MTTASIHSTDRPEAEVIHGLVTALDKDAISLGKDEASRRVRADVKALRAAIDGVGGTVASTLLALDTSVDRLHLSHMRPFFKQTLRRLRTALNMDVDYALKPSAYEHRRRN
jgi:hypothetical protein